MAATTFVKPDSVLARTAREVVQAHAGGGGPRDGMTICPVCGEPLPCGAGRAAAEVLFAAGLAESSGLVLASRQGLGPAAASPFGAALPPGDAGPSLGGALAPGMSDWPAASAVPSVPDGPAVADGPAVSDGPAASPAPAAAGEVGPAGGSGPGRDAAPGEDGPSGLTGAMAARPPAGPDEGLFRRPPAAPIPSTDAEEEVPSGLSFSASQPAEIEAARPAPSVDPLEPIPQAGPVLPPEPVLPPGPALPSEAALPSEPALPSGPARPSEPAQQPDEIDPLLLGPPLHTRQNRPLDAPQFTPSTSPAPAGSGSPVVEAPVAAAQPAAGGPDRAGSRTEHPAPVGFDQPGPAGGPSHGQQPGQPGAAGPGPGHQPVGPGRPGTAGPGLAPVEPGLAGPGRAHQPGGLGRPAQAAPEPGQFTPGGLAGQPGIAGLAGTTGPAGRPPLEPPPTNAPNRTVDPAQRAESPLATAGPGTPPSLGQQLSGSGLPVAGRPPQPDATGRQSVTGQQSATAPLGRGNRPPLEPPQMGQLNRPLQAQPADPAVAGQAGIESPAAQPSGLPPTGPVAAPAPGVPVPGPEERGPEAGGPEDAEPSGLPASAARHTSGTGLWGVAQSTGAPSGLSATNPATGPTAAGLGPADFEGQAHQPPSPAVRWAAEAAPDEAPSGLPQPAPVVQRWSDDPDEHQE